MADSVGQGSGHCVLLVIVVLCEKSVSDSVSVNGVCKRVSACVVDVAGYLEEYPEVAVVKVHAVVFY